MTINTVETGQTTMQIIYNSLRTRPKDTEYLASRTGFRGEIFYDIDTNSLRLYDSEQVGGYALAKADLTNISNTAFANKAVAAGLVNEAGDVYGPTTSTSTAITRFADTSGKNLKNSTVTISDAGAVVAPKAGSVIPFYFADQAAFPSATTYEGAIVFSAADDRMYVASSGQWVGQAGTADIPDVTDFITALDVPSIFSNVVVGPVTISAATTTDTVTFFSGDGIAITADAETNTVTVSAVNNLGNLTVSATTIDSTDSSGITFTPAVTFESDLNIENELTVRGIATAEKFVTNSVGVPELYSPTTLNLVAGQAVVLSNSVLRLGRFNTAQRDELVVQEGDVIFNVSASKAQIYVGGVWENLH